VKVDVLKNGVTVGSRTLTNQTLGFGTTFDKAILAQFGPLATAAVGFSNSDTLSVRVSMKVSESSQGGANASGAIRLWYNIPTLSGKASLLFARKGTSEVKYYLISPFRLQRDGVVAGPTQDVAAVVYKTGFTDLGTWSITGP
jgi:hypothetical protein